MGRAESQLRTTRRDGWTIARQLRFLDTLTLTRSVTEAAQAAGMSRESAHRLRRRAELFAALWDRALAPPIEREGHTPALTDGQLMRLLGNHYRRESKGFWPQRANGKPGS